MRLVALPPVLSSPSRFNSFLLRPMDNQLPFGFSSKGMRGEPRNRAGFDDHERSSLVPTANSAPRNESAHYLSLLSRFCYDDHFANIVDEWSDFEVPQRKNEIRQAAHFAPPPCSLDQLQDASHNSMQRWVYRVLTLNRSRIEPSTPICVSHTMALQELVAWWKLDGSQFCGLRTREELIDPTRAQGDAWVGSCGFARQIMCDMLWLELCNLRGEWHIVERATRILQARVAEYTQPGQENLYFRPTACRRAPRDHRRIITEPQNDRATMRRPVIQDESKRISHGPKLTTFMSKPTHTSQQSDRPHVTHFVEPRHTLPHHPKNQAPNDLMSSNCATPDGQSEAVIRDARSSVVTGSFGDQYDTNQEKNTGDDGYRDSVEIDGKPQSQTARMSLDHHCQDVDEAANLGDKDVKVIREVVYDWLEMPDEEDTD